jgi:MarR family transcriptional regulator, 2-MHQ and catechol-resistance regulon repressor
MAEEATDDPRLTAVGLVFEAHAGLKAQLERRLEAEVGIPIQWFEVLLRLARSPGHRLRMSDLAAQTSVTPSGLTRVVDRLCEARLVARESCREDRRSWYATLTPEGRARLDAAVPAHLRHIDEVVGSVLDPDELDQLAALVRKLRDATNPAATQVSGRPR